MKKLNEKYNSDFTIEIETNLTGMIVGNVNVQNPIIFVINGTIIGDLTVEKNSRAILYGTINGNIHSSGICEVYGTVNGELYDLNNNLFIDKNAKINKL